MGGGRQRLLSDGAARPLTDANRPRPGPPAKQQKARGGAQREAAPEAAAAASDVRRRPSPPPPPPPALPAAADALLPGLDDDLPPEGGPCQLPLQPGSGEQGVASFGNAFAAGDSLRVTSITRSSSARRVSPLRLVVQADAAEGRRLSRLPPQERPAARVRTVPLRRGRQQAAASAAPSCSAASGDDACSTAAAESGPAAAPEQPAVQSRGELLLPFPVPLVPAAPAAPPCEDATGSSSECEGQMEECEAEMPAANSAAAVGAGAPNGDPARAATGGGAEGAEGGSSGSIQEMGMQVGSPSAAAIYAGVPAEEEAEGMDDAPAGPPAWLQRQGSCRNEPGMRVEGPAPPVPMHSNQHATAVWRNMWLSGLQWHNACRAGHPIRQGSPWAFIPLDPNEPLLDLFMFHTAVMPEHVIAGTARFEDILLGDPQLHSAALETGVFSYGVWGVPAPGPNGVALYEGGRAMAMPVSLRCAPPPTVALFLACVWHEANRAETVQHATFTFTSGGDRVADERCLKYPPAELLEWLRTAVGGGKRYAEELLAGLAGVACFGVE